MTLSLDGDIKCEFLPFFVVWIDIGNGGYEPLYAAQGAPGAAAPNYGATARPL